MTGLPYLLQPYEQKLLPVNMILKTVCQNYFNLCRQPLAGGGAHHPHLVS